MPMPPAPSVDTFRRLWFRLSESLVFCQNE